MKQHSLALTFLVTILFTLFGSTLSGCVRSPSRTHGTEAAHTDTYDVAVSYLDTHAFPDVDIYLSVTSASGSPVEGLDSNAFSATENGRPVSSLQFLQPDSQTINAVLVIDRSGSMGAIGTIVGSATGVPLEVAPGSNERMLRQLRPSDYVLVVNPPPAAGNWIKVRTLDAPVQEGFVPVQMLQFGPSKLDGAKEAASRFIKLMRPEDRVALIAFDDTTVLLQGLTSDRDRLLQQVDNMEVGANTAYFDAVATAVGQLANVPGRRYIIAMTDGVDNRSQTTAAAAIETAVAHQVQINTVGLGNPDAPPDDDERVDGEILHQMAVATGGESFVTPSANELSGLYGAIAHRTQFAYEIRYHAPVSELDGYGRNVVVAIRIGSGTNRLSFRYNPGGLIPVQVAQSRSVKSAEAPTMVAIDLRKARSAAANEFFLVSLLVLTVGILLPKLTGALGGPVGTWWFQRTAVKMVRTGSRYEGMLCLNEWTPQDCIKVGERIVVCPRCRQPTHAWCWAENGHKCYGKDLPCSGKGFVGQVASW